MDIDERLRRHSILARTTGQLWLGRDGERSGIVCLVTPPIHCVKVAVV